MRGHGPPSPRHDSVAVTFQDPGQLTAHGPPESSTGQARTPGPEALLQGRLPLPPATGSVQEWKLGTALVPAARQRGDKGPNVLQELCSRGCLQAGRGGLLTGEWASSQRSGPGREGRGAAKASLIKHEAPTMAPLPTEPSSRGHRGLRQPQPRRGSQTRPRPVGTGSASAWVMGGGRVAKSLCSCALL